MGISGISPTSLILILVIVLLLFGTKKLRGLGSDLGSAIKGFKKSVSDDENSDAEAKKVTDETNDEEFRTEDKVDIKKEKTQ